MSLGDGEAPTLAPEVAGASAPSAYAQAQFEPETRRQGVALCLSGGGFRAAAFHLGGLRRLNELGVLPRVDTITSVSGGSITAARLAAAFPVWPAPGESIPESEWDARLVRPLRSFMRRNLRTLPIALSLLPWNWPRSGIAASHVAAGYRASVTAMPLTDLPARPRYVICSTDLVFGANWTFEKEGVGDYQAGHGSAPKGWDVARAVAASSCFPPFFTPLPIAFRPDQLSGGMYPPGPKRDQMVAGLRLCDGGVYDNLGLEPVWRNKAVILVSDGGAVFDFAPHGTLVGDVLRAATVMGHQVHALRMRWLISNFIDHKLDGAYWGLGSVVGHYPTAPDKAYSADLVENVISQIRTDLDAFSEAELDVLENHGYLVAEAAIQSHVPGLIARPAPLKVPYPRWLDETLVRQRLATSNERTLLGRFKST